MKKFLPLALILPAIAHADDTTKPDPWDKIASVKTISKDELTKKLIGTWQCRFDDTSGYIGISYHSTLTFKDDGTFTSQKTVHTNSPKGKYQVNTTRSWQLVDFDEWSLQEKIITIDLLSFDDPSLKDALGRDLERALDPNVVAESVMIFGKQDGKDTLTRMEVPWGIAFGECVKD